MKIKTIAAGCLCALLLGACSPDSDSMESRMADSMDLLDKHKEHINQERLKETLAGVGKGDAEAEWKQGGLMCMIFSYGGSASDFGKVIELENYWYHKAEEDGCPYAMLDLANMVNEGQRVAGRATGRAGSQGCRVHRSQGRKERVGCRLPQLVL